MQANLLDYVQLAEVLENENIWSLLTHVNSGPSFSRDHHILEFVQGKTFAGHGVHGMVKHLTCGVSVFDLVS